MPSTHALSLILLILVLHAGSVWAFGAGEIPNYGFLSGKAFRHGDIENTLATMLIRITSPEGNGAGFLGMVKKLAGLEGEKFGSLNVKRTYFGNWLYCPDSQRGPFQCGFWVWLMGSRDYSQAVDVGTLSKKGLDIHMIRLLVWILGYLSFGFATEEFEVRLQFRRSQFKVLEGY
jgi:hypothetical protein